MPHSSSSSLEWSCDKPEGLGKKVLALAWDKEKNSPPETARRALGSGRVDLNHRPQRPERCALTRLRYAPINYSVPHQRGRRKSSWNVNMDRWAQGGPREPDVGVASPTGERRDWAAEGRSGGLVKEWGRGVGWGGEGEPPGEPPRR